MRRTAASTVEVLVAIVLLSVAMTALLKFTAQVHQGLHDRELAARLDWELLNAREQIASWPIDEITAERIASLPIHGSLAQSLEQPRWQVDLKTIVAPTDALQVTLELECNLRGQAARPATLTFWIPKIEGDS